MAANRRPHKAYRPRPVRTDAFLHAIDRVATLLNHQRATLLAPLQVAVDAFRTGQGTAAHWANLADGMNVGEVLCELQIGSNLAPQFQAAQQALAAVHRRHAERNSWTLRADELASLTDAVWCAGVQMQHCSQGEMQDAINTVKRRTAAALAGSVAAGTTICVGLLGATTAA